MYPDRIDFLIEFDGFYQALFDDIKKDRYTGPTSIRS